MKVITLDEQHIDAFFDYCRKHRYDHDESFLYEEDFEEFVIGEENPTWLLMDDENIIGTLSLKATEYLLSGKRARVRIFHCEKTLQEPYQMLLDAADPLDAKIEKIEMFLPQKLTETQNIVKAMGFEYYRTSYVMLWNHESKPESVFPEGYELRPFVHDTDEAHYAHIRNTAFKEMKGAEQPITIEMVVKIANQSYNLEKGTQILWYHDAPVGILNMIEEIDEKGKHSFVAPIALLPEHQGKGLGKQLLKAGIGLGIDQGYKDCMLCVNAENEQALSLYTKVGFEVDMAVDCLVRKLPPAAHR